MEARNLRNMTMAQTPLLGEENTPLHLGQSGGATGFEGGATPRHQVAFTPNPLATPAHLRGTDVSATPRNADGSLPSQTPLRTPMRDDLSINPADAMATPMDTPRDLRMRQMSAKRALQAGFKNLPKAENNFELLVPEDEEGDEEGGEGMLSVEDAAERDARMRKALEEEKRRAFERQSEVLKRKMPRPPRVDAGRLLEQLGTEGEEVNSLIDAELVALLDHDSIIDPLPGTSRPGGSRSAYLPPDDDVAAEAKAQVAAELASMLGQDAGAPVDDLRAQVCRLSSPSLSDDSFSWAQSRQHLVLDVQSRTWVDPSSLTSSQLVEGYTASLREARDVMAREAAKAAKVERKLAKLLGGYQAVSGALTKRIVTATREFASQHVDLVSFERLSVNEQVGGPRRVEALKEEVEGLAVRERMLQGRFAELAEERREAGRRVEELEARVEAEAEAMNEAALAAMDEE